MRPPSPRYIHGDDRYRLKDPLSLLDPALVAMLEQQFGTAATWREPDDVVSLADQDTIELAGLDVRVLHAPGHTEGSVMFALPTVPDGCRRQRSGLHPPVRRRALRRRRSVAPTCPAADEDAMTRSLRDVVLPLPDDTLVLPGHGPATTDRA